MNESLLVVKNLRKQYGGIVPIQDVSFHINHREICALIGPNGAGKTTLLNLISGLVPVTSGQILFAGQDITHTSSRQAARLRIARTFQITSIFPSHTPYETLWVALQSQQSVWRSMSSLAAREKIGRRADEIVERLNLTAVRDVQASTLSYGDQRVLEFGIALATEPKLLLLDEPTAGMSPSETARISGIIQDLKGSVAVAIVEHDMEVVMRLASRVYVLDYGKIVAEGTPDEIAANSLVQSIYLGVA